MAKTTIELADEETTELIVALSMWRSMLNAQHGSGFFATTPFQVLRAKFPGEKDLFAARPREIHLSDTELGALKAVLEMQRWAGGCALNSSIYEKVLRAIDKRSSTLVGRLSLSWVQRRARAKGYFGLEAIISTLGGRD
jgi:hypothetical protein